ncbi:hypothetical protein BDN70DRAFT_937615 [Pholiota conissans]|uniref:Uncharacterized protein n=1 Tax=Pholiota conissans TaxID=109636 RepID=A0A9P5YPQ3_9AGAR|nr:hypothetical protein BDN70DRAFT_937615 [Pholiota conissans]
MVVALPSGSLDASESAAQSSQPPPVIAPWIGCHPHKEKVSITTPTAEQALLDATSGSSPLPQPQADEETSTDNVFVATMHDRLRAEQCGEAEAFLQDIIKRYRFKLPKNIERDDSSWEKITGSVTYALTQARMQVKKKIQEGIDRDMNIFDLARIIIHDRPCHPTLPLCARVALMRAAYVETQGGENFWNAVDNRLSIIYKAAGANATMISLTFMKILEVDRETYGVGQLQDFEVPDVIADEWQQRVDNAIAAAGI